MTQDPRDDDRHRLSAFFRDELRLGLAEATSCDELAAYVDGLLGLEERAALEERLAVDPELRQEVDDLRALRAQMPPPAARPGSAFPMGLAAAAAIAALTFWLTHGTSPGPRAGGSREIAAVTPTPLALLQDGSLRLALSGDGTLTGLPATDAPVRDAVASALHGRLPRPRGLETLRTGASALLGSSGRPPSFVPLSPIGSRVWSDTPTFRWTPQDGARAYEVAVFDTDLRKQAASGPITDTTWVPARGLARGRAFLWQVTAITSRGRITVPAPPAPEARFEVAGAETVAEIERRRATAPGSHLVSALALIEAGLLDDAEGELRALSAANPGSPEVARLLDALQAIRRSQ